MDRRRRGREECIEGGGRGGEVYSRQKKEHRGEGAQREEREWTEEGERERHASITEKQA